MWIRSALASNSIEDVFFLEVTLSDEYVNGSFGSGIWLTVSKNGFIIIDMTPKQHVIINQYYD